MKTCQPYETMLQNNLMNDDLSAHLETCDDCLLYQALLNQSKIELKTGYIEKTIVINNALEHASKIQGRRNIASLLLFIVIALALISLVVMLFSTTITGSVKYYIAFLSTAMPFSLPVITYFRRKAAIR